MPQARINVDTLFSEAIAMDDAEARESFIQRASDGNPLLRQHLQKLVTAHFRAGSFLQQPAGSLGSVEATVQAISSEPDATTATAQIAGSTIGPYKIRESLGDGGMGSVYVAEQERPVRRKVALKLIKPGMDSRAVIARFEAERQALTMMDHPHIAKVLDAGTTDWGHPYFVMELVKGLPITEHCDNYQLAVSERLELFIQVCRAVQHAHQKAVIHRDLKPSNILVAMHDTTPVVKVIDFGVAKALGSKLTENTMYTGFNQLVGTPLYMSPEQAGHSSLDIDTRSDIYSLGVLLYELLTGSTPFDSATLKQAGYDEMRRMIREVDPPRPSARISTLNAVNLSTISERRHIEPQRLSRTLRGELDWIVMKAMEKDRSRRYESVSGMQKDIERFLLNEPIQARPPSLAYLLQKYAKRHTGLLATATLLLVMMVGATIVSTHFAIRAHQAVLDATAARNDANNEKKDAIAARNDAEKEKKDAIAARELADKRLAQSRLDFDRALQSLDTIVSEVTSAEFAQLPGSTKIRKEILDRAMQFYREITDGHDNDPHARLQQAEAHRRIAMINMLLGDREAELRELNQSIAMIEKLMQEYPGEREYSSPLCGHIFYRMHSPLRTPEERLSDAEFGLQMTRESVKQGLSEALPHAPMMIFKAAEFQPKGSPRAEALVDESLKFSQEHGLPVIPPVYHWLGRRALAAGDVELAIEHHLKAIAGFRRTSADPQQDHPFTERCLADLVLCDLGRIYEQAGRLAEAETAYREAFEDSLQNNAEYSSLVAVRDGVGHSSAHLIRFLRMQGRWEEAANVRKSVIEQIQPTPGDLDSLVNRGRLLARIATNGEDNDLATADFEQALKLDPNNMEALFGLFNQRMWRSSPRDSEACLALAKRMSETSPNDYRGWKALSDSYMADGRIDEAEAAIDKWLKCESVGDDPRIRLAAILQKQGDLTTALRLIDEVIQVNPSLIEAWQERGNLHLSLNQYELARDDYQTALKLFESSYAHKRLAEASFGLGDYATTLSSLEASFRLNPDDLTVLTWIAPEGIADCGDETLRLGILKLADKAVERDGSRSPAWIERAQLRIAFGNTDGAASDLNSAQHILEANSDQEAFTNSFTYIATKLAEVLRSQGKTDDASRVYAQVITTSQGHLQRHPQDLESTNRLAWLLATAPASEQRDSEQALKLATEADRLSPENPVILNTLGVAQVRAGQWEAGIATLDKSAQGLPQDMYSLNGFFLAMAHWQTGQKEVARDYYKRSVESMEKHCPENVELKQFRAEAETLLELRQN